MKLPDFKLERYFAKHEFTAKYLLCCSDCEAMSISDLLAIEEGAREKFLQTWLGYTESPGSPALRHAISKVYESVQPDDILVFTGAEEAIYLFVQSCLDQDGHAIVHSPCYQSLFEVANHVAGSVDRWHADPANEWKLDLNQLTELIRPNTRVIVVNTPHNPTGSLMSHEDWLSLHRLATDKGIIVFCDEVYRESEYNPSDRLPAGCDISPTAVSLGVMSKTYGLAGLRIGWVSTRNQEVLTRLQSMKDYTTICNSAPSEFLAELGLRHREKLISRNVSIIQNNLELLDQFFAKHSSQFQWQRPKAGAIAFPKRVGQDATEFCETVLQKSGVMLAPAPMFATDENRFRIGFGRADMNEALKVLDAYLESSTHF